MEELKLCRFFKKEWIKFLMREKSEYIEKLVAINRITKVVKGGRRFGFAALVVVGESKRFYWNRKGKVKTSP